MIRSLLGLVLAGLLLPVAATAAEAPKREVLAVGHFDATEALRADMEGRHKGLELQRFVQSLDGHFISALAQTRKFTIVGRSDLKEVLKEQDLFNSGIIDPSTAAEPGKIKGAKYRLVTSLDSFLDTKETQDFGNGRHGFRRRIQFSAQVKIYDASTGELLEAPNIQHERVEVLTGNTGQNLGEERTDEQLPKAARDFAQKVVSRVVDSLYPARIIDVDETQVTINRGEEAGYKVGDVLNVYGPSKTITDEDTGQVIKRKGTLLGKVRVTSVEPTYTQGEIVDGKSIVKNSLVRPAEPQGTTN